MLEQLYPHFLSSTGICTDTRKIEKGNLFFALKGGNFNGNKFAKKALDDGASFAIIDEIEYKEDDRFILVEEVLTALQQLATYHRDQLDIPIIAITGTNGKTTTKELLHAVLSTTFETYATAGNFNNHIGVPLSLLSIKKEHEIAIIEMGANHTKEIEAYCQWAKPTHGLITNIGSAHLEGFGSLEGVIKAKTELYQYLQENNGTVFYNVEDDLLTEKSESISSRKNYGFSNKADFSFTIKKDFPCVSIKINDTVIQSNLFGSYNATNIATALAVSSFFDVKNENAKKGIENYFPANNRSQIIEREGQTIILDAYNANPTSMTAALHSFAKMECKKAVFLGDMFELGDSSDKEHHAIADLTNTLIFDKIVLVGKAFESPAKKIDAIHFETSEEAKFWYQTSNLENFAILIKGSRGMKMERIID
ncbi:MAG: UDP-N-acetylmuramoyl-tripeptide--D-alanyl-D-alanine ligase [Chitinophagales bacterium]